MRSNCTCLSPAQLPAEGTHTVSFLLARCNGVAAEWLNGQCQAAAAAGLMLPMLLLHQQC
jgi:hypothetical protein